MKDFRGSTPYSEGNSRPGTSASIDPRAPTPSTRYGEGGGSTSAYSNNSSRAQGLSSRTPTPSQWAREYALRAQSSDMPTRCSTALGGSPLQTAGSLELRQRPMSVADVRTGGGYMSARGHSGTTSDGRPKTSDASGNGAAERLRSSSKSREAGARLLFPEAGSYEELFHRTPPTAEELDDKRPVRSRPMPPQRSPESARGPRMLPPVNGRSLGGVPRGPPNPLTPPPQMAPPTIHPHNAWRTLVQWVPAAGSHEDPDFGYSLICRTLGSDHSITIDDLGNMPRACFDHLEPGLSYYFQVSACNCRGWGEWSNPSSPYVVPQPPARPDGKPFDFSDSSALGSVADGRPLSSSEFPHKATLNWDEPCSHGAQITGYNIQYSLNPSDAHAVESITSSSRGTSIEITDLLPNRVYYLRTQAFNSVGTSDWTDWSAGVATKATPPEQPAPPRMVHSKPYELLIKWVAPFACGFRIMNYTVLISENELMENAMVLPVGNSEEKVDDDCTLRVVDLSPNTFYFFQVRAENEIGMSHWSGTSDGVQTKPSVPAACSHVQVIQNVYEKMEVQWQAPETFGLPISSFVVRWLGAEHPMKEQSRIEVPASDGHNERGNRMSVWVNNIRPGSKLVFQAAARSDAGIGPFSELSDLVLATPGKPGAPPPPTVKLRTGTSMVVQVQDNTVENGAPITGYECRWDLQPTSTNPVNIRGSMRELRRLEPGIPRMFEIAATGLKKRGPYFFSVRASNRIGKSVWSQPSEPMLLHFVGPSKMTAPHLTESQIGALVMAYTPSAEMGMTKGGGVLEYEMRYSRWLQLLQARGSDEGAVENQDHDEVFLTRWYAKQATRGPPPPERIENLLTGRSYHFQVRAISDNGGGPWSDISSPFEVLPSKPENPTPPAVAIGTDGPYSIQLSITLPENNGRKIESCALKMYGPCWDDQEGVAEFRDLYTIKHIDVIEERRERAYVKDASEPTWDTVWHHTVIHLEAGAYYKFMCNVQNCEGTSEWSSSSVALSTAGTAPDRCEAPVLETIDGVEELTHNSFKVNWKPPHNGGTPITNYTVCWANNPRFAGFKTIDCPETCLSLTDLEPFQWYYMKVRAENSVGFGRYSDFDSAHSIGCFLTLATVPTVCTKITAEIKENDEVHVRWAKPACSGGHIITNYKLIASKDDTMEKLEFELKLKAGREQVLKDLAPDTAWYFDVVAGSSVGYGPWTGIPAHVRTHPVTIDQAIGPSIPSAPDCAIRAGTKDVKAHLEVNWKCPELYDKKKGFIYKTGIQTHMINTYNVKVMTGKPILSECDGDDLNELLLEQKDVKQVRDRRTVPKDESNRVTYEELLPGRYYFAMVQSQSDSGLSDWSDVATGVWSGAILPDDTTGFEPVERKLESITVQWVCPHGNGADVTGFRLRWKYKEHTDAVKMRYSKHGSKPSGPKKTKALEDEAEDDCESEWDDEVEDLGELHQAGDMEYSTGTTVQGMELSLEDCKFGPSPPPILEEYAPRGRTHLGQVCRAELRGLQPGRFYVAEVQTVNPVGTSAWTHSGLLRTASNIPGPPTGLRGLPETATTDGVSFCWVGPEEDGGEPIEGYEIAWMRISYRQSPPTDIDQILKEGNCQARLKNAADNVNFRAEGLMPGNMAIPIVRCWNSVGFSSWCWLLALVEGKFEEIVEELAALPSAPSAVTIPPVLRKDKAADHRPHSLCASWKCPVVNGWPVKYFLLKICLGGEPPPKSGKDAGKIEKEMRLDHDGVSPDWGEGDEVCLPFVNVDLIPGAPYTLNVRACTGNDAIGDCEEWGAVSMPESAPPDYPLQPPPLTCPWQWPDALQVEWVEPCMNGAPQTMCDVRYAATSDMTDARRISDKEAGEAVDSKTAVIGSLKYTTEYFFQCRIANVVGWSNWSLVSPAFLTKACRPEAPENLRPTERQKESITMRWEAPSDHGAAINAYEIILVDAIQSERFVGLVKKANECHYLNEAHEYDADTADAAVWNVMNAIELKAKSKKVVEDPSDPDAAMNVFDGLLGGISYMAVVRAGNKCGWSDWSTDVSVTTPSAEPERCPQASLLESKMTTVSVEYRMPYDNGAPITKIEFTWSRMTGPKDRHKARILGGKAEDHRYSASGTITIDLSKGAPEAAPPHGIGGKGDILLDGLEPGTEYDVQCRAANENGFGPMSYTTRMLTAPGRPDAPGKVRHAQAASDERPDSPRRVSEAAVDDPEAPTVCFARTARLQASEVVHVRQGRPKSSGELAVSKITENE